MVTSREQKDAQHEESQLDGTTAVFGAPRERVGTAEAAGRTSSARGHVRGDPTMKDGRRGQHTMSSGPSAFRSTPSGAPCRWEVAARGSTDPQWRRPAIRGSPGRWLRYSTAVLRGSMKASSSEARRTLESKQGNLAWNAMVPISSEVGDASLRRQGPALPL